MSRRRENKRIRRLSPASVPRAKGRSYTAQADIGLEDLAVKRMTRLAKGTVAQSRPQRQSQRRNVVSDPPETCVQDRMSWAGVCASRPQYTSQDCPVCCRRTRQLEHCRRFVCTHCGYADDPDTNAAVNMLHRALAGGNTVYSVYVPAVRVAAQNHVPECQGL